MNKSFDFFFSKKVTSSMVLLTFLAFKLCSQDLNQPKAKDRTAIKNELKERRKLLKVEISDLNKTTRIHKPLFRRYGRNIKDIVYDFDQKVFVYDSGLRDKFNNPPYEIHELDGIRIKIKNINPFIYSVDLYELQNDRINNEKLSEASQKINLKIAIEPINSFRLQNERLSNSSDLTQAIAEKDKEILNLKMELSARENTIGWQDTITLINSLEKDKIIILEESIESSKKLSLKANENEEQLNRRKIIELEKALSSNLDILDSRITHINGYVNFYNQLLYVVNSPENDFQKVQKARDQLFRAFDLAPGIDQIPVFYFNAVKNLEASIKLIQKNCDDLIALNGSEIKYERIVLQVQQLQNELNKFNHNQLVGNSVTLYKLVKEANFTLVYETLAIAENVDNIRYKIEFKADDSFDLPRSVGNFNLDISMKILEGLKIDVSPAIVMDFGLVDPIYYFDKSVEAVSGMDKEFVTIKQNDATGNISPSIGTLLNAYKRGSTNFKLGASMGFGLSNKLRFRLYFGPTLIVGRQERIVFTGGVAMGLVERLADEYTLNEKVEFPHSSLPNSVPVIPDKFKFGGFFSIGFNLTGKENKSFVEKIKFN